MATLKDMEQVLSQIDRMRSIASRWLATETVSAMERDLMLDKLRMLYEEILFWDGESLTTDVTAEDPWNVENEATKSASTETPARTVATAVPAEQSVNAEQPVSSEMVDESDTVESVAETVVSEVADPQPAAWMRSHAAKESAAEPKLFSDEAHVRTRVDKQVILSLYGEESPSVSRPFAGAHQPPAQPEDTMYESTASESARGESPREEEPVVAPVQPGQPVQATRPEEAFVVQEQPVQPESVERPEPTLASSSPAPKVLGEIIVTPTESLGDRLGKQHPHTDVASRLRAQTITDLQHSIGINDRFLLINELFGGDTALYEQTLARLNEFTSLDDAMIYIQEHFDWNPDAAGTTFLVELLERKLEN